MCCEYFFMPITGLHINFIYLLFREVAMTYTWRSEDSLPGSGLFLYLMGPRNQNEVTRLRDKTPLATEPLAGPDQSSYMCINRSR